MGQPAGLLVTALRRAVLRHGLGTGTIRTLSSTARMDSEDQASKQALVMFNKPVQNKILCNKVVNYKPVVYDRYSLLLYSISYLVVRELDGFHVPGSPGFKP